MNSYLAQAQNNHWSNRRLLSACFALSHEEYVAKRTSFFPSIEKTLLHILEVDRFYLAALAFDVEGQRRADVGAVPLDELAQLQSAADVRLITYCESIDDDLLYRLAQVVRPEGLVLERVDRLLLHLFQHQIHHRGQVHAMVSGTRVAPPQLDEFYLEGDRQRRAMDEVSSPFA
jgi:uncharacterized damage-inducible protein DinB